MYNGNEHMGGQISTPETGRDGSIEGDEEEENERADRDADVNKDSKKHFERLPNSQIRRKVLITSPIQISKNGVEHAFDKVPAIFFVLRDLPSGLMEIGDEKGKSLGLVEKEDICEWNSRVVWHPAKLGHYDAFNSPEDIEKDNPSRLVTIDDVPEECIFPVLASENEGKYKFIGSPIHGGENVRGKFPTWIKEDNIRYGTTGIMISIGDAKDWVADLRYSVQKMKLLVEQNPNGREQLFPLVYYLHSNLLDAISGEKVGRANDQPFSERFEYIRREVETVSPSDFPMISLAQLVLSWGEDMDRYLGDCERKARKIEGLYTSASTSGGSVLTFYVHKSDGSTVRSSRCFFLSESCVPR